MSKGGNNNQQRRDSESAGAGAATMEKPAKEHDEKISVRLWCDDDKECRWEAPVVMGKVFPKSQSPVVVDPKTGKAMRDASGEVQRVYQAGRVTKMRRSLFEALKKKIAEPFEVDDSGRRISGIVDCDGKPIGHFLHIEEFDGEGNFVADPVGRKITKLNEKIADTAAEIDDLTTNPNMSEQDIELANMLREKLRNLSRERKKLQGN